MQHASRNQQVAGKCASSVTSTPRGFNAITRRSIFRDLRRGYPELVPAIRVWYPRRARLFTFGEPAVNGDGEQYFSEGRAPRSEVLSS